MALNNAPMSGFPSQKKPLPLDDPNAQQGPGLPPPPVPGTPDVPKLALNAANGWGTQPEAPAPQPTGGTSTGAASPLASFSAPAGTAQSAAPTLDTFMGQQPAPLPASPYTGQAASLQQPQAVQMESAVTPPPTPAPATKQGGTYDPNLDTNGTGVDSNGNVSGGNTTSNYPGSGGPTYGTGVSPEEAAAWNFKENRPKTAEELAADKTGPTDQGGGNGPSPQQPGTQPPAGSTNPAYYKPATTPVDQNIADWNTQFGDWLKHNMANESPYSTDLIKQGQGVLEDAINRQTAAGQRQIEEYMASRGLTGSSLEAGQMKDYQAQMQEQYRQGMFQLGQAQVDAYLKQEQTVGSLASQFMSGLTDEQRNALSSVQSQMSLAMQKYGIDKSSADAAAGRETQKFIAMEGLVAQYGGDVSGSEWDSFAAMFGPNDAKLYLGERPGGAATTPSGAQGSPPPGTDMTKPPGRVSWSGTSAQWDSIATQYGAEYAKWLLGPRPTA